MKVTGSLTGCKIKESEKNNYNPKKIERHLAYIEEKTNEYLKQLEASKQQELEQTQSELRNLGGEINELAQRVASASEELSASSDEQARGAQQQKGQSDAVATAMEEMTATVMSGQKRRPDL